MYNEQEVSGIWSQRQCIIHGSVCGVCL